MKAFLLACVWLASMNLFAAPIPQSFYDSIKIDVQKFTLDNGMTVILSEDHSAPVISLHQWFRVGSKHELVGQTGLAHFFEHLMFKGTKKYPTGVFDKVIQANGGSNNAFTSRDYTGYYINIPSNKLELVLDIESDRMHNLQFNPKLIDSERGVVKEERRMRIENSVQGAIWEQTFKTIFKVNQYRWPVIGYMRDLNAATLDDFKKFYQTYYSPNNSVLVVVGDINISQAKKWIKKYYGPLKAQKIPPLKVIEEPKQNGHRTAVLKKDVQSSTFMVGFPTDNVNSEDFHALEILSYILGNGDSSRLHKRLVYREQIASSAWAYAYPLMLKGMFLVNASVKPGQNLNKAVSSVYGELYKVRTKPVTEKELDKAKNMLISEFVSQLKTASGKAKALASAEIVVGDHRRVFTDLKKYAKVTSADVLRVAKKYLVPANRSIIKVVPK